MKENSMYKRLLSAFLAVVVLVSLVAVAQPVGRAYAAQTDDVYTQDFEDGTVLMVHGGTGEQQNRLDVKTNSYLQLTGLSGTQLKTPAILVEANAEYILSYRVKASNVSGSFYLHALGQEWDDSDNYSGLAAVPGAIREATDGWQTVEGAYTFTKNHVQFFFEEAWGGSADVCLDDITLIHAATGEIAYKESFDVTESFATNWGNPAQARIVETLPEYYLQIAGASIHSVRTEGINIEADKEYTLSYRVKADNVSGNAYFYVWRQEWDDADNYSGIISTVDGITAATDGWQTVSVNFTSTKNHVQFFFEEAWGGSVDICLDDISLKAVDSDTAAYSQDFTSQQALTVHNAGNGGSQSFVQDGNHYLALLGASGYSVKTDGISLEAGAEYALSYQVKMENVSDSVYFYVWRQEWDDADNYSGLINTVDGITAATDGWQTVETTFTADKNHVQFFFEQAWPGSADISLDNIKLTKIASEPVETEPPATEPPVVEPVTMETALSFNRVDGTTWFLNATDVSDITGSYYFGTANVDGSEQKVIFEKTDAGFVVYEGFFTSLPQNSFQIPEGAVLYQFDPNVSWNDPISGGQQIRITQTVTVEAVAGGWFVAGSKAEIAVSFNNVDGTTWFLNASDVSNITGSYYFGTANVDGSAQKVIFEKTGAGFVVYESFFASLPQSSFQIPEGTVLYQFDPNVNWNAPVSGGQWITVNQAMSVEATAGGWYVAGSKTEVTLSFNRVDKSADNTWYLNTANVSDIIGSYYFATVKVDGADQKIVLEKNDAGFVIYGSFFTTYGGASVPQSSFQIPEGTVLYQFDPNVNWNAPVSGGQWITVTQALEVVAVGATWYEKVGDTVPEFIVEQWNISLGDNLDVNFHIHISDAVAEAGYVQIAVGNNEAVSYKIADAQKTESGAYIFTAELAVAQMVDAITLSVENGVTVATYSVEAYAEAILSDENQSAYHAIVKEMLNYGAKAQIYFAYNDEDLAGADIDLSETGSHDISETVVEDMAVNGSTDGVTFYGASMLFRSKNAVRFYFTGSCEGVTVTVNGEAVTAQQKSADQWYVEVADINPQDLDQTITVEVNGELSVVYSPMNYMARMSAKGSEKLQALLNALYNYHLAAEALAA